MIVRMRHLDLVCLAREREATLTALRDLGAVHLDLAVASGSSVAAAKGEAAEAERAVRLIMKARGKTPLEEVNLHEHEVAFVLELEKDRETLKGAAEELERQIRQYEPFGDFDPELAKKLLGEVRDLRETVALPEQLPPMRLAKMQEKLARVRNRITIDDAKIAGCDEGFILKRFPALADQVAFESAKELMAEQGALAAISGWVPETQVEALTAAAHAQGWGLLMREPAEGETPPTWIRPPKLFRPVKVLFEGLGIAPAYEEADVSVPFMCYFSLFFAMLVGDGGYGAIILALTLLGWRKFSGVVRSQTPKAVMTRSWLVLMTVFSLATIGWGVLSNTWFGAGLPWCADWPTVKWLGDPSYKNMMFLCFTIGVSHLMLARIWNGISMLNDRRCLGQFAWAGILFFMYWITNTIVGIFTGGIPVALYVVFGLSFLIVFLQSKGIEKGMLFLNVMSTLGDVISYVRLFAVGLASVKVAENFNNMALSIFNSTELIWVKPLLAIGMVLVLLVGHGLNFAMAGLSILVHAVRLNTLEFSNHKGVSWAGYAFKPFKSAKE